ITFASRGESPICQQDLEYDPEKWNPISQGRSPTTTLPPRSEEIFEQARGFRVADAAIDFRPMMAGGRGKEPHAVLDRAALGIGRAVIEPADARERDRGRAHGAGLERHVEIAVDEPLAAEHRRRPANRQHLAMRG